MHFDIMIKPFFIAQIGDLENIYNFLLLFCLLRFNDLYLSH